MINPKIRSTTNEIANLLEQKMADYGTENLEIFGEFGVLVRATDKLARLRHLIQNAQEPLHETLEDTWMDLAGYAILALLIRRDQLNPDKARQEEIRSSIFHGFEPVEDKWRKKGIDDSRREYPEQNQDPTGTEGGDCL